MTSPPAPLRLWINGEPHSLAAPVTIVELLEQLRVDRRAVAVERNRELVRKDAYATTAVTDGDRLEIVSFVGGG
jgi:thiamine biosynthesis protein ThiS